MTKATHPVTEPIPSHIKVRFFPHAAKRSETPTTLLINPHEHAIIDPFTFARYPREMQADQNSDQNQPQPDRRALIASARRDAHAFRGAFLDKFARLERSLGPVLMLAASMPEYTSVTSKFPHLLGQKTAMLRKMAETEGPLKAQATNLVPQLDALSKFEEMRNFMAHAVLEVAWTEHDEVLYIFRMIKLAKGRAEPVVLLKSKDEARAVGAELGRIINGLSRDLDAIAQNHATKMTPLPAAAKQSR